MVRVSDEQKRTVRNKILEVSKEFFMERGFHETKTKEIAKEVGIAEGTLFNYFPTKTDIFFETMAAGYMTDPHAKDAINYQDDVVDMIFDLFYRTIKALIKLPKKTIRDLASAAVQMSRKRSGMIHRIIQLDYNLMDDLEQMIQRLIDDHRMRSCNARMAAETVFCVVVGEMVLYVYEDDVDRDVMFQHIREKLTFTLSGYLL